MGETEDRTLDAIGSLVGLLLRVREQCDALPWILRLVEAGRKLHGEDHPHTRVFINLYTNTLAQVAQQFDLTQHVLQHRHRDLHLVLTNRKPAHRKGRVQVIDATQWFKPLHKNLGKKNCELSDD
jgi:hypothetical protein